jgi:toxin YoeB
LEIVYVKEALADIEFWKKSGNKIIQNKIKRLLNDIAEHPFTGIGKPEPLQYQLSGLWSRRINAEHRLIYEVEEDSITVYSLRGHYN